ncbi:uncharacterized protein PAC_12778 [Phialocephala subalpina]|uniref:Cytochrome P450 n=1 Tax=Phialocephala subalpina TaxID=576137 RepID=A0A1L7XCX9_9HELO|nr:uncharacterized protein PAC_12778 [Phialocephala subalpina]
MLIYFITRPRRQRPPRQRSHISYLCSLGWCFIEKSPSLRKPLFRGRSILLSLCLQWGISCFYRDCTRADKLYYCHPQPQPCLRLSSSPLRHSLQQSQHRLPRKPISPLPMPRPLHPPSNVDASTVITSTSTSTTSQPTPTSFSLIGSISGVNYVLSHNGASGTNMIAKSVEIASPPNVIFTFDNAGHLVSLAGFKAAIPSPFNDPQVRDDRGALSCTASGGTVNYLSFYKANSFGIAAMASSSNLDPTYNTPFTFRGTACITQALSAQSSADDIKSQKFGAWRSLRNINCRSLNSMVEHEYRQHNGSNPDHCKFDKDIQFGSSVSPIALHSQKVQKSLNRFLNQIELIPKEKRASVRAELATAMKSSTGPIGLTALEQLPYLTGCVQESIRLSYRVSTRLQHIAPDETLVFNDDSKQFLPERWIGHPYLDKYLVSFSKGTRLCIGVNLAYAELYIGIARVFRRLGSVDVRGSEDEGFLELLETTNDGVEMKKDVFIPLTGKGSKGARVLIKKW